VKGGIAEVFGRLADVNCRLWHVQERVYDFEDVPAEKKDGVVKQLALLNLERTQCIDQIDSTFRACSAARRVVARSLPECSSHAPSPH